MKKKLTVILALMLLLATLGGCALPQGLLPDRGGADLSGKLEELFSRLADPSLLSRPDAVKFSDIPYIRPDLEQIRSDVAAVEEALDNGASLKQVEALLDVCFDDYDNFTTMSTLANIYNCLDLRDEYYAAEYEWISAAEAELSDLFDELYYACSLSSLGHELEEDYFWEGFCDDYADPNESMYTDRAVELMQRESELITRYREIVADPTIFYDGSERSVYELLEEVSDFDYLEIRMLYFTRYCEPLAEIYIELMRVRSEMAEEMGFSSCEEMEYVYSYDRDYSPEDGAAFVAGVKDHLVPLYRRASDRGLFYGADYSALSPEKLRAGIAAIAKSVGRDCAETFSFMDRCELYNIEPSLYKADTSFEVYLDSYQSPFIFLNPAGTSEDLTTFMHELGHATDAYVNDGAYESLDLAEVFSQAMEFLSLSHMDGVLPAREIRQMRESLMLDALDSFVEQSLFADFEHKAYSLGADALSADKLNELFLQSTVDFGLCESGFEEYYQYLWMDIVHLFEYPFYVVSYPVSLQTAMQIYALELQEPGKGLDKYFEMLPRDYDSFTETVEAAGLESPFSDGALAATAAMISEALF